MKFYLLLFASILFASQAAVSAQGFSKTTLDLALGETSIKINVYEKTGARITFFAPHHNEQIAIKSTKDFILRNGGRLIEIESLDKNGNFARNLQFNLQGKASTVDPNRIFTANGRRCSGLSGEAETAVESFSEALLKIIFPDNEKFSNGGKKAVVAVHNNANVDEKSPERRAADLTAHSFARNISAESEAAHGAFEAQAAGVFLANGENDSDNFIFLSTPLYLGFFAENDFNVVVQKTARQLQTNLCSVDDGSFSVFAGQKDIEYICLEADAASGEARQRQMLDAVYRLLEKNADKKSAQTAQTISEIEHSRRSL